MNIIFVIFGATGDLAKKKLFPALHDIYKNNKDIELDILALGRRDFDDDSFRSFVEEEVGPYFRKKTDFEGFMKKISYQKLELSEKEDYLQLKYLLGLCPANSEIIFYLAISPEFFGDFVDNFKSIGFGRKIKVIFEKPFGMDLASAQALNEKIMEVFAEDEIYRIDHYIGKEAIQNILAFRFTNTIFQAIWNNMHIDNIQITASEDVGVGDRGGYYDKFGAIRDMMQNHLLQVLSLVIMDPPSKIDEDGIAQEKIKVFRSIDLGPDFEKNVVFGQYEGYKDEPGVGKDSETETFVAMKFCVSTWNFVGVPIYVRTGKQMSKKSTRIVIEFKEVPNILYNTSGNIEKNRIILEVQPNEGIDMHFNIKQDSYGNEVTRVKSVFEKEGESKEAYVKLLEDAIVGDKTLFTNWKMLEESWRALEKLINCKTSCPFVYPYKQGEDGPEMARKLIEDDGKKWYD